MVSCLICIGIVVIAECRVRFELAFTVTSDELRLLHEKGRRNVTRQVVQLG